MPIVRTTNKRGLDASNRPAWCGVTAAGIFRVHRGGRRFDCHYHDYNEYWLVFKGKAKICSEEVEFYVKAGDIVCTRAGDEHDVLEVYEDFEAFFFEEAGPADARIGHLHRDAEKAAGHPVPALPLPADFPE